MLDSRRSFLFSFAGAGILVLLGQQMPEQPQPAQRLPTGPQGKSHPNNPAALVAHEKELRETTDHLLVKVQEFRAQLDGTHTADVFSVNMYKQTEEIEKLAKLLRSRARP